MKAILHAGRSILSGVGFVLVFPFFFLLLLFILVWEHFRPSPMPAWLKKDSYKGDEYPGVYEWVTANYPEPAKDSQPQLSTPQPSTP